MKNRFQSENESTLASLKANEARFKDFVDVATDWFWEMDADLRFTYQSERFEEVMGIPASAVLGKTREEAFSGYIDDSEKWAKRGEKLKSHEPYSMIFSMKSANGSTRTLQTKAKPIFDNTGEFTGYRGIGTDITKQVEIELELRESEARYKDFVEIASDNIWEMDSDLRFSFISERVKELSGVSQLEVIGKTREEIWSQHMANHYQWKQHYEDLKNHKVIEPFVVEWSQPHKKDQYILINGKPTFDENKNFTGYRGVTRDVTDLTLAQKSMEHALKSAESANLAKTNFLANMSHEIRTPMALIIGMIDLLKETELADEQVSHLKIIEDAGTSLLALINRILDISKIETENLALQNQRLNIKESLEVIRESSAHAFSEKSLSFSLDIHEGVVLEQIGDPFRLQQVLKNLVDNAIKFTEEGGVCISVKNCNSSTGLTILHFTVSDTGIGFPKELEEDIFDSFVQQDSSSTREFGGVGLGLSICKQIVNAMGGTIWAESEPHKGSSFHFTLVPKQNNELPAEQISPSETLSSYGRPLNILIVEDEAILAKMILAFIKKTPHQGESACNGQEAFEKVKTRSFDLAFMDLRMPLMDGYTATRKIREWENTYHIEPMPIVALTASVMAEDVERCLSSGFNSHLGKPIDKAKFLKIIDGYWKKASSKNGERSNNHQASAF